MVLASLAIIILFVPYMLVGLLILIYSRKKPNIRKDYSYTPTVTVYLPTYNEEKNIAAKLDNLLKQDYPITEILVYDCSTDNTRKIVEDYANRYSIIKLIKQPYRIGMARTFNQAIQQSNGEIFVKTDADSISLSRNSVRELVANFAEANVGAVTGTRVNSSRWEKRYNDFMTIIQLAESNIDSLVIGHSSSLLAFRKTAMEPVNPNSMAEDTEEVIMIRKKGYKTILDPFVVSFEEIPRRFSEHRKQKDRRAEGIVRVLFKNKHILFNKKFGKYGFVVFPLEIFILVISPFLLLSIAGAISYTILIYNPMFLVPFFGIIAFIFLAKIGKMYSVLDVQISGLIATIKTLSVKENPFWNKVR